MEGGSIECRIRDAIPTDIDSRVSEMLLESQGAPQGQGENYQLLCSQSKSASASVYSYGVKNTSATNPIEFTLDLSECALNGVKHNTKSEIIKKLVKPGEVEFLAHLVPQVGEPFRVGMLKHSAKEIPVKKR